MHIYINAYIYIQTNLEKLLLKLPKPHPKLRVLLGAPSHTKTHQFCEGDLPESIPIPTVLSYSKSHTIFLSHGTSITPLQLLGDRSEFPSPGRSSFVFIL